jgi:HK97 family phage major capsid protein
MKLTLTDDTGDEYTITRWTPFEVSLVTIPADETVGVGRAKELLPQPAASAAHKEHVMTPEEQAAADAAARNKLTAVEAEKERRTAAINLAKSSKIDPRVEARWIEEGTPLSKIASEILDVMEERGKQRPISASALGLDRKETQRYSLFRAIRALKFGGNNPKFLEEAAFEIECSRSVAKQLNRQLTSSILIPGEILERPLGREAAEQGLQRRAMATIPGPKGGFLVNVEDMGFIDILRNRSVGMAMGVRRLPGLVGNVQFARQTGKPSVTWQGGEGTSVTAADQTLGQLSMTPRTCIVITDVSEQLLAQATPSAEAFVMADLAADVAIDGVDNAIFNGLGGAQPLGIKNTTGVATGQDAASATYAKILAFISTAGTANAIRGNPGWVTNTAGAIKLMQVQRFTSTDTPVWAGNALDGQLVGFNAMSSEQLASGNLIFGSWNEVVLGEWGVLELAMDTGGTRFNQAQVGIRAMWMVDVLVRYPQAFVVSTNLS